MSVKKPLVALTYTIIIAVVFIFIKLGIVANYKTGFYSLLIFAALVAVFHFLGNNSIIDKSGTYKWKIWMEFLMVLIISSLIFFMLPPIIFDDTGFVLRYLENFYDGYLFRYNVQDSPVYGISGFIHGLYSGLLCFFHIAKPHQALLISNYTGFIFTGWYIYLILKKLVNRQAMPFLIWVICITCTPRYLLVANAGLETTLHLTFVFGAIYYLVTQKARPFFLFTALMIISKLDAVPVAFTGIFYYLVFRLNIYNDKRELLKDTRLIVLYFIIPLAIGMGCITLLFGSPLPQSAFAKLYYHSHPNNHWFPFLEYFLGDYQRIALLGSGLAFWLMNVAEVIWKKDWALSVNGLFGSMFLAILALYYFYNPGERMLWYYSMPELFVTIQVVYSVYHYSNTYIGGKYANATVLLFLFFFSNIAWKDAYDNLKYLETATIVAEGERTKIGRDIAAMGNSGQVLMAGHGLISHPFKGYVIDMTGLNSRVATRYQLKIDSIIADYKPDFMVSHSNNIAVDLSNKYNYELVHIYRNITLYNNYSWVLLRKSAASGKRLLTYPDEKLNAGGYTTSGLGITLQPVNGALRLADTLKAAKKILHIGLKTARTDNVIAYSIFKNGELWKTETIKNTQGEGNNLHINDYEMEVSGADSVIFTSANQQEFQVVQPLYEIFR